MRREVTAARKPRRRREFFLRRFLKMYTLGACHTRSPQLNVSTKQGIQEFLFTVHQTRAFIYCA